MIITFCGHSQILGHPELEDEIIRIIEEKANDGPVTFYLGMYGTFDSIAESACLRYKKQNAQAELVFVSPYYNETYIKKLDWLLADFDDTLYPLKHPRYTKYEIIKRNEWMVKSSDLVIAYVKRGFGGAAKTLAYAIKHNIPYINLAKESF